ncbi:MAG: GNAT family N-acetyltransferase [Pseudomonadota bacterium]
MAQRLTRPLGVSDYADARPVFAVLSEDVADETAFAALLAHPGNAVFGSFEGTTLAAIVTLHVLPNMTRGARPYALIENVASLPSHRGTGHGRDAMQAAIKAAWDAECYKIMLLTGQDTGARGFYERLGFRADQKFGMQMRRVPVRVPD